MLLVQRPHFEIHSLRSEGAENPGDRILSGEGKSLSGRLQVEIGGHSN